MRWAGLGLFVSLKGLSLCQGQKLDTRMERSCSTLQWQDANVKVFQLAEGADEVQFILDGMRTVCDQLETSPGKKKKHKGMWLVSVIDPGGERGGNTQMQPKIYSLTMNS